MKEIPYYSRRRRGGPAGREVSEESHPLPRSGSLRRTRASAAKAAIARDGLEYVTFLYLGAGFRVGPSLNMALLERGRFASADSRLTEIGIERGIFASADHCRWWLAE